MLQRIAPIARNGLYTTRASAALSFKRLQLSNGFLHTVARSNQSPTCRKMFPIPGVQVSLTRSFGHDTVAATFLDVGDVTERVLMVVKNFEKVDPAKVTPTSHFNKDLGLDSLDAVEVVMALEEEFVLEIPDAEAEKILTCEDAIKFISQHPRAK